MTEKLRFFVSIGIVLYFMLLIMLIRKRSISLRYALLWGVLGVVFILLDVFPNLLYIICNILGVQTPVFGLYAVFILLIFVVLIVLTGIISRQAEKIRTLTQSAALLEKRIRELEDASAR
ncbi:MAG: DUF2304 domain-containing protein [Treponema sp.]|nr:DUF2304 domain-containing protein [Treponema sp.]